jgi:isopentenyl phosphate kinase
VLEWNLYPLESALARGLLPVVYGDVVFDKDLGGTIFSTEDLFEHLAAVLRPRRLLLAGLQPGVWADFPTCTRLLEEIAPHNLPEILPAIGGSAAPDVTGGMASKVSQSLELAQRFPGLQVRIFSGLESGRLRDALLGAAVGTLIHAGD